MEPSIPGYFCFIWNWVSDAQNFGRSFSTVLWISSTILWYLLLTLDGKETKIPIPVLLQKQWNCLPSTDPIVIKSWILNFILLQLTWMTIRTQQSTTKLFKRLAHSNDQLYGVDLVKPDIDYEKPSMVSFLILENPKLIILELYDKLRKIAIHTNTKRWKKIQGLCF